MGLQGRLYSFNSSPTINTTVDCTFIIHDFDLSGNGQIITKEVCEENMHTLINKPVLVDYTYEGNSLTDHFGDHAVALSTNRDTGEDIIVTNTVAIGVFTGVEIANVEGKDVLLGHASLWSDRYTNCIKLLHETLNKGIQVGSSCEYLFCNYQMNEGIQYVISPITYDGHTILNSEEGRGNGVVAPAYDCSKVISFNQAILTDINKNVNNKEVDKTKKEEGDLKVENKFLKAMNGMSFGDIRDGIYVALSKVMPSAEYSDAWISSYATYDEYFIYETVEEEKYVTYKVAYNEVDGEIQVNLENKVKVTREQVWVEVDKSQASMNTLKEEKEVVEASLNEANEKIATLEAEVLAEKESKIDLGEQIASLNTRVEELVPFKEKVEQVEYQEKLEVATNSYKEKFVALNGLEKFEEEEIQELIKETLDVEKSQNARAQLADVILEMVSTIKPTIEGEEVVKPIKEVCNKKVENLIPTNNYEDYGFAI